MFGCVKFLNDSHINEPCFVPISAIKSFDPLNFDQKKQYNMFWSPNEDDDPINFKEEFNADNDSKRFIDGAGLPSAGYYKAIILQVAGK